MTKQLLTALLIAGLSATAKAEPAVYYCEMTALVKVESDGTVNEYTPERFTMRVDGLTASFGGDGYVGGSEAELKWPFTPKVSESFSSVDGRFYFYDKILTHSQHSIDKSKFVISFVARCEDF